jgi:hypothetical protein
MAGFEGGDEAQDVVPMILDEITADAFAQKRAEAG